MCSTCQTYFWRINIEKLWKISVACVAHTIPVVGVVFIVVAIISATIIRPALIIMGLCCSVVYYCADYYGIMEIFLPFVSHSSVIRCLFLSKPIQLHDSWFFTTSNRKHYLVLLRNDFLSWYYYDWKSITALKKYFGGYIKLAEEDVGTWYGRLCPPRGPQTLLYILSTS